MKLTLIQPMSDGTYRVKELDVRERTLSLYETDEVFKSVESARVSILCEGMHRVYGSPNGEIWI